MTRPRHPTNTQTSLLRVPALRNCAKFSAERETAVLKGRLTGGAGGGEYSMAPITSHTPWTPWAKPYWLRGPTQAVTGFPQWENGKRGENGPLCVSFRTIGGVGAGPLGRGQPPHLSLAPVPRLSRAQSNSAPFPVSDWLQIPQPQLAPPTPKCLLLPKEAPGMAGTCLPTSDLIQNKEQFPRETRTQVITKEEENR